MKRLALIALLPGCGLTYHLMRDRMSEGSHATVKIGEDGAEGCQDMMDMIVREESREALWQQAQKARDQFRSSANFGKGMERVADPTGQERTPNTTLGGSQEWRGETETEADEKDEFAGSLLGKLGILGTAGGSSILTAILAFLGGGKLKSRSMGGTITQLKKFGNIMGGKLLARGGTTDDISTSYNEAGPKAKKEIKAGFAAAKPTYEKLVEAEKQRIAAEVAKT